MSRPKKIRRARREALKAAEPKSILHRIIDSAGKHIGYQIWCEGCRERHEFYTSLPNAWNAQWQFSGDEKQPTFQPSLLVKSGHFVDGKHPCWCDYNREHPKKKGPTCYCCHSFIENGKIRYLADSSHALAGQTVPLTPF